MREISTKQERTTLVAMNSSLLRLHFMRNALLKAPWLPDSPPKKPLKIPPRGKSFLLKEIFSDWGEISRNTKNSISTPMTRLISVTSKLWFKKLYFIIKLFWAINERDRLPNTAAIIAGMPNLISTSLLLFFPNKNNLKILFRKCTMAVKLMAMGAGKNKIKTGVKTVPSPNPEKRVIPEIRNVEMAIIV